MPTRVLFVIDFGTYTTSSYASRGKPLWTMLYGLLSNSARCLFVIQYYYLHPINLQCSTDLYRTAWKSSYNHGHCDQQGYALLDNVVLFGRAVSCEV